MRSPISQGRSPISTGLKDSRLAAVNCNDGQTVARQAGCVRALVARWGVGTMIAARG